MTPSSPATHTVRPSTSASAEDTQDSANSSASSGRRAPLLTLAGLLCIVALITSATGAPWSVAALTAGLFAVITLAGVWLSVIDIRTRLLPNAIVFPLALVVAAGVIAIAITSHDTNRLWGALIGASGFGLFYLTLGLIGGMGLGDIKVATILGTWLGLISWQLLPTALVISYLLALPQALVILIRSRSVHASLAFGPYLIAGAIATAAASFMGWAPSW